jgi:uncharacterized protein
MKEIVLSGVLEFEWDEGNSTKSWIKHRVSIKEQEQTFFDTHKRVFVDSKHSQEEQRFLLFGQTEKGRVLIIAFTKRKDKIRCISARPMNNKEKPIYEKTT